MNAHHVLPTVQHATSTDVSPAMVLIISYNSHQKFVYLLAHKISILAPQIVAYVRFANLHVSLVKINHKTAPLVILRLQTSTYPITSV